MLDAKMNGSRGQWLIFWTVQICMKAIVVSLLGEDNARVTFPGWVWGRRLAHLPIVTAPVSRGAAGVAPTQPYVSLIIAVAETPCPWSSLHLFPFYTLVKHLLLIILVFSDGLWRLVHNFRLSCLELM